MAQASNNQRTGERGNAFLYILIGVVLFAALMYTFTRSARQGGENIGTKKVEIAAVEVLGYGQRMSRAVSLLIQKGCSESQLDFGNDIFLMVNNTPAQAAGHNAGSIPTCAVFGPGTGVAPEISSADAQSTSTTGWTATWLKPGHGMAYEAVVTNLGTASTDLIYIVAGLKRDVCMRINEKIGVTNTSGEPPVEDDTDVVGFDGTINATGILGDNDANVAGKRAFCYRTSTSPAFYSFVSVLIER